MRSYREYLPMEYWTVIRNRWSSWGLERSRDYYLFVEMVEKVRWVEYIHYLS